MKQAETSYDVIIVGGGLVGASLACALGHLPISVAMIEAVANPVRLAEDYDARTLALSYSSRQIFQGLGIWDSIADTVSTIRNIHVSQEGSFSVARFDAAHQNLPALGHVVPFQHLQNSLNIASSGIKNLTTFCPAKLTAITPEEDHANILIEFEGKSQALRGKLIVACDGASSITRELLSIGTHEHNYEQRALVANVSVKKSKPQVAYERFTKQGPLALLPVGDERYALVWTAQEDRCQELLGMSDEDFIQQIQRLFGFRLGRFTQVGKRHSFPLRLVKSKAQTARRVVLLGNAVHSLHPIGAQGLNLGLRDVAAIAQLIDDAVKKQKDVGDAALLSAYEKWREPDQKRMIQFTHSLTKVFAKSWIGLPPLRDMGLFALDTFPILRDSFAKHSVGLWGEVPKLACGLSLGE